MEKISKNKEFFTIPEVARIIGVSRITIFQKVKKGVIPALRVGRNFIIKKDDIYELVGNEISERVNQEIKLAVKKVVQEYGETLKLLGKE